MSLAAGLPPLQGEGWGGVVDRTGWGGVIDRPGWGGVVDRTGTCLTGPLPGPPLAWERGVGGQY